MGDLLRLGRVVGAVSRLVGRHRVASVISVVLAVGWFVAGIGRADAAGTVPRPDEGPDFYRLADALGTASVVLAAVSLGSVVGVVGAYSLWGAWGARLRRVEPAGVWDDDRDTLLRPGSQSAVTGSYGHGYPDSYGYSVTGANAYSVWDRGQPVRVDLTHGGPGVSDRGARAAGAPVLRAAGDRVGWVE